MLQQVRHVLNLDSKLLLYHALIESKLSYGALAWAPLTPKKYTDKLLQLQKRAVRLICNKPRLCHTGPLFHKLQILRLEDIVQLQAATLALAFQHCELPAGLLTLFQQQEVQECAQSQYIFRTSTIVQRGQSDQSVSNLVRSWNRNLGLSNLSLNVRKRAEKKQLMEKYLQPCLIQGCLSCTPSQCHH